jgi:hypothetical protein
MGRARDISAVIYASVEIVHAVGVVLLWGAFWFSLSEYVGYLDIASWLAFIVFAAAAFKQFSYRWLRVIVAFLVFYFLPIAGAVLYARNTHLIPLEWMFVSFRVLLLGLFAVKLAIAGFSYVWSGHQERGSIGALSESM